jgi:mono/diheme cytochrome c family protein
MKRTVCTALLCISAALLLRGQTKIRQTPISPTSPASGQEMFMTYCASCHGKDGKGNGPAAPALKLPPSDLTMLAKKNGGSFPSNKVLASISGQSGEPAHGSREMPVWGQVFSRTGGEAVSNLRLSNLTRYLESIQVK